MKIHPRLRFLRAAGWLSILCMAHSWPLAAQFAYTTNKSAVTITKYTGPGGRVTIPGIIGGLPVTQIGDLALAGRDDLVTVIISSNIISIGAYAFAACPNLTAIIVDPQNDFLPGGALSVRSCCGDSRARAVSNQVRPQMRWEPEARLVTTGSESIAHGL